MTSRGVGCAADAGGGPRRPVVGRRGGAAQRCPGTGHASILPTAAADALGWNVEAYVQTPFTGAHIHQAPAGSNGDVVVPLSTTVGPLGAIVGCRTGLDEELVQNILTTPSDIYVNLHTEEHPGGALRGQLLPVEFVAIGELQPTQEVPPADVQGGGFASVWTDASDHTTLCYSYDFELANGEGAAVAHIHQAPAGENGEVVRPLQLPQGPPGVPVAACDRGVDEALVDALIAEPTGFYINVHTATFPRGAVRGQLQNPFTGGGA